MQRLVTGRLESGDLIDATRMVTIAVSEPVVNVSPTGLVRAVANGQALRFVDYSRARLSKPATRTRCFS